MNEAGDTFACFGSACSVYVIGDGAGDTVAWARRRLESWHHQFTRFEPSSELSRLNHDPRHAVPVSKTMAHFAELAAAAAEMTDGLVDATLLGEIEAAGYTRDLTDPLPLQVALEQAPLRRPAGRNRASRSHLVRVLSGHNLVIRPRGLRLDSGGLAKGMFCDLLADALGSYDAFAIDCAGDVRVGGAAKIARLVQVTSPFDGSVIHSFESAATAAATSGIGRRSWLDADANPAHHLLDPSTGRPAFTGVVQVTALAESAALAEIRAKAALLSGPARAADWLPDGGVAVLDDGTHQIVPAASQEALRFVAQSA